MKFLDIPVGIWATSFFGVAGLGLTVALFSIPSTMVAPVALTAVTILLTIFVPVAIVPKGHFTIGRVLIGALYGFFWPLGLPIVVGVTISNRIPDKSETDNEILPEHNQGS